MATFDWLQYTGNGGAGTHASNSFGEELGTGASALAFKYVDSSGNANSTDDPLTPGSTAFAVVLRPYWGTRTDANITVDNMYYWMYRNSSTDVGSIEPASDRKRADGEWNWSTGEMLLIGKTYSATAGCSAFNTATGPPTPPVHSLGSTQGSSFAKQYSSLPAGSTIIGWSTATFASGGSTFPVGDWVVFQLSLGSSYPLGPGGESYLIIQYDIAEG